jgi:hypothetical protein
LTDQKPAASPSSYQKGLAALDEDDLDTAIAVFTAAIADDPNNDLSIGAF